MLIPMPTLHARPSGQIILSPANDLPAAESGLPVSLLPTALLTLPSLSVALAQNAGSDATTGAGAGTEEDDVELEDDEFDDDEFEDFDDDDDDDFDDEDDDDFDDEDDEDFDDDEDLDDDEEAKQV